MREYRGFFFCFFVFAFVLFFFFVCFCFVLFSFFLDFHMQKYTSICEFPRAEIHAERCRMR